MYDKPDDIEDSGTVNEQDDQSQTDEPMESPPDKTLWFGLQYDSETVEQGETVGNGALATVRWYDVEPVGDGHLQGQFAAFKDVVGDMIDRGVFTLSTAKRYLKRKLAERVEDRQELRIPTGESDPVRTNSK